MRLKKVKTSEFKLYVTPRYVKRYKDNQYEPFSSAIVKNYLRPNSTFVDVGAHYGYYSILAYLSQENVKVISVEPVKENFEILKKNIQAHKVRNYELYNLAASDKEETKFLNITEASDSVGFYNHPLTRTVKRIKIKTVPLDQLLQGQKINFIKLDVEGHELPVLSGMKQILRNNRDLLLLVEFYPELQKRAGYNPEELVKRLETLGFELILIDEVKRKYFRLNQNKYSWRDLMNQNLYANIFCLPKKKAVLTAYFSHTGELGGAERSLLDLLHQTQKYYALSHVIVPQKGPLLERLKEKAIPFDLISYNRWVSAKKHTELKDSLSSLVNIVDYIDELEKINPQVIYTNTIAIPWGALAAFFLSRSHLWHIHEFGDKDHGLFFTTTFAECARVVSILSEKIIYNSKAVQKAYEKYIDKKKGETVYYNIEITKRLLTQKIEKIYKDKNSLRIIIVGLISVSKGQDQAVKAVTDLIKNGYNIELLILGLYNNEDPYFQSLKKYIFANKINRIYFKNFVSNPYPYIGKADLLLMCSRSEAFGRVTLEAMMLGKPVIGADRGGTKELIRNSYNGFLYKYGDIEDLKEKIKFCSNHRDEIKRLGQNALAFSKKNFSQEKFAKRIYKMLLKLKKKKREHFPINKKILALMIKKSIDFQEIEKINGENERLKNEVLSINKKLNNIYNSKTWKLIRLYQRLFKSN